MEADFVKLVWMLNNLKYGKLLQLQNLENETTY